MVWERLGVTKDFLPPKLKKGLPTSASIPNMRHHNDALVAQLDRVLGYEPSGRRFESFRVRHFFYDFAHFNLAKNTLSRLSITSGSNAIWQFRLL